MKGGAGWLRKLKSWAGTSKLTASTRIPTERYKIRAKQRNNHKTPTAHLKHTTNKN
uniref:Uncharacterized protein n=1 Tax=Rhizophora mucronata TaxID=61149 RepID=A0A2P2R4H8_RHIMU